MYWLEIQCPNNELLVWEYLKARQVIFPINYINLVVKLEPKNMIKRLTHYKIVLY